MRCHTKSIYAHIQRGFIVHSLFRGGGKLHGGVKYVVERGVECDELAACDADNDAVLESTLVAGDCHLCLACVVNHQSAVICERDGGVFTINRVNRDGVALVVCFLWKHLCFKSVVTGVIGHVKVDEPVFVL